jgi:hypothetical protein
MSLERSKPKPKPRLPKYRRTSYQRQMSSTLSEAKRILEKVKSRRKSRRERISPPSRIYRTRTQKRGLREPEQEPIKASERDSRQQSALKLSQSVLSAQPDGSILISKTQPLNAEERDENISSSHHDEPAVIKLSPKPSEASSDKNVRNSSSQALNISVDDAPLQPLKFPIKPSYSESLARLEEIQRNRTLLRR